MFDKVLDERKCVSELKSLRPFDSGSGNESVHFCAGPPSSRSCYLTKLLSKATARVWCLDDVSDLRKPLE